ncbi:MAG TPA: hypothetical protein VGF86_03380 [Candidatus Tumulicola sp.]
MSFLRRWLDLAKDRKRVGLRPHRDVIVDAPYEAAYDRVLEAAEFVLGASVASRDRGSGTIEASFGLVNSERVRCTLQSIDDRRTAIRVEAFFPAGAAPRERSLAVEALADALEAPAAG